MAHPNVTNAISSKRASERISASKMHVAIALLDDIRASAHDPRNMDKSVILDRARTGGYVQIGGDYGTGPGRNGNCRVGGKRGQSGPRKAAGNCKIRANGF